MNPRLWVYWIVWLSLSWALVYYTWTTASIVNHLETAYDRNPYSIPMDSRFQKIKITPLTFPDYLSYLAADSAINNCSIVLPGGEADKQMIADTFQTVFSEAAYYPAFQQHFAAVMIIWFMLVACTLCNVCFKIYPYSLRELWARADGKDSEISRRANVLGWVHYMFSYLACFLCVVCYAAMLGVVMSRDANNLQKHNALDLEFSKTAVTPVEFVEQVRESDCIVQKDSSCVWQAVDVFYLSQAIRFYDIADAARPDKDFWGVFFGVAVVMCILTVMVMLYGAIFVCMKHWDDNETSSNYVGEGVPLHSEGEILSEMDTANMGVLG